MFGSKLIYLPLEFLEFERCNLLAVMGERDVNNVFCWDASPGRIIQADLNTLWVGVVDDDGKFTRSYGGG